MAKIKLTKLCPFRFWTLSGSALFWMLALYPAKAQIVPDATLPNNSIVTPSGNTIIITGGTSVESNLFHSFREFSVPTNREAFFNNTVDVQNIISRVTGGAISNIDGLIRANGTANLFFINPNGIIFGPNASLNIGGSFVASTANSLRFADNTEFSATNPQATPLLTVSVPIGLQFSSNPGKIVNQSQASLNGAVNSNDISAPTGLQVLEGKTLALVGGNVSLEGGNLTAAGGRIEVGSVGTGLVNLTETAQGYALGYLGVPNFLDINLSGGAVVDASGKSGGEIQVWGRNINLTDNAQIYSATLGALPGGNLTVDAVESVNLSEDNTALATYALGIGSAGNLTITTKKLTVESGAFIQTPSFGQGQAGNLLVRATDAVELSGTTTDGQFPSGLSAQVSRDATQKGGNLTIETGRLTIRNGAVVNASTSGSATAGNVLVRATDVELVGFATTPNGIFPSGISAKVAEDAIDNAGDAGTLTIETQRLTVQGGAQISTTARKGGNAGDLIVNASDSIRLSGALPDATPDRGSSGILVSAEPPSARGNVGNLNITTRLLTVENGAKITAENNGTGQGGTLSLNVSQLAIRDGGLVLSGSFAQGPGGTLTVNAAESVDVIGKGIIGSTPVVSTLSAAATDFGKAGDLNITTPSLNVQDGAEVTVSGKGFGPAGNLTVTANDIRLNQGSLTAQTNAGEGANIKLLGLDLLLLQNQSQISAQAFNNAKGGNIEIDAINGVVAAVPDQNNDIIANAIQGQGGNIIITTKRIFGMTEGKSTPLNTTNDIDVSSQFNNPGTVTINTPDVDPSRGLAQLSTVLVKAPKIVASGCATFDSGGSSFTITGRGGLPPSPDQPLINDVVWSDTRLRATTSQQTRENLAAKPPSKPKAEPIAIVPATGWVFNGKGEVTLISAAPNTTNLGSNPATCSEHSD